MARRGKKAIKKRARKVKLMNLETGEWEYTTFYLRDDEPDPDHTKTFIAESLKRFVKRNYGPGYLESISITQEELRKQVEETEQEMDDWWEDWKRENGNEGYYKS